MSASLALALALAASPGAAAAPVAPAPAARAPAAEFPIVDAAEVHARLVRNDGLLVDTRSAAEFEQGHIVGAIHIPADRVQAEAARLPRDRKTPIVFYCRGAG